ncbi:TolC family protein [Candidatus Sumerlaeota bacterium]|nr:TolC family protein [Candidatus Sumerlaeota bacterium]
MDVIKNKVFITLLFLLCTTVGVAEITTPVLSVEFFLLNAMEKYPQIKQLHSMIREREARVREYESRSKWHLEGRLESRKGDITGMDFTNPQIYAEFSLRRALPFSFSQRRWTAEIMLEQSEILALQAELEQVRRQLKKKIMENYADYSVNYERIEITKETLGTLQKKYRTLKNLVEHGEALRRDLLETDSEIDIWRRKEKELNKLLMDNHTVLVQCAQVNAPLFVPEPVPVVRYANILLPPYEDLKERTLRNAPQLAKIASRESAYKKAAKYFGALPLESEFYIRSDVLSSNSDESFGVGAGVSFSIPLRARRIAHSRRKQYIEKSIQLKSSAQLQRDELERNLKMAYYDFILQQQALLTAQSRIRFTEEAQRVLELQKRYLPEEIEGIPAVQVLNANVHRLRSMLELCDAKEKISSAFYNLKELTALDLLPGEEFYLENMEHSIWVWGDKIFTSDDEMERFLDIARFLKINRVYLGLTQSLREKMLKRKTHKVAEFIFKLHKQGIKVELLLGENSWIFPEKRNKLIQIVTDWLEYQKSQPTIYRWDALHLDIEPHAQSLRPLGKCWNDVKDAYIRDYLKTLKAVYSEVQPIKRNYSPELQRSFSIYVDVPPWWDREIHDGRSLIKWVLSNCDGVVLMNYAEDEFTRRAVPLKTIQLASVYGKPVWIGNEIKQFDNVALPQIAEKWHNEIKQMYEYYGIYPSLQGFALHHYTELTQEK